jgi:hypothetical protein
MGTVKSISNQFQNEPSVFALLVDNISKMSLSEQKLLWMKLNKEKIAELAREIDAGSSPDTLTDNEINMLVREARSNVRKKKTRLNASL